MKKKIFNSLLLLSCLAAVVLGIKILFFNNKEANFKIASNADFYIVSNNNIKSYKVENNTPKLLHTDKLAIAEDVNGWFSKGEIQNRYLIFSEGHSKSAKKNENILSIDFEKGEVVKRSSNKYAYTGAGSTTDYYYTFQATGDDGFLYSFDKNGKEIDSYKFTSSALPSTQFTGSKGKLYMIITQENQKSKIFESSLYTFNDGNNLKVLEKQNIDDNSEYLYDFTSLEKIEENLYSPVTSRRNRKTFEVTPDNRIMKFDLKNNEKSFITLKENYPNLIYKSKSENYLITVHEPNMLQKSGFSVINTKNNENYFVDVSDILNSKIYEESNIWTLNTTKDNKLIILAGNSVLLYDLDNKTLLSETKIFNDNTETPLHVWTK
ncbi:MULTISPECIES: hypothetical protein [Lactococcus]|uniref:hypothetical protein n=1 Tax=Lactococcus TaxID=1357 RepID=UPI002041C6AB|nr:MULTISPECIES: hypothetical protein [Lactococcus]